MYSSVGSSSSYRPIVLISADLYKGATGENPNKTRPEDGHKKAHDGIIRARIPLHQAAGEYHVLIAVADGFGIARLSEITRNEAEMAIGPAAINAAEMHVKRLAGLPEGSALRTGHIDKLAEIALLERLPDGARKKAADALVGLGAWTAKQAELALLRRKKPEHRIFPMKRREAFQKTAAVIGKVALF